MHDLNCMSEKGKVQLDSKDLIPCGQLIRTSWLILRNQRNNEIVLMDLNYLGHARVELDNDGLNEQE